jgi:hypothetical protein
MIFRSDGLLRGSREERTEAIRSLGKAEWNLETFLDLHCGLLDHAEEVRAAAMDALQEIANRKPEPIAVAPAQLLSYFLFSFTVSSGIRPYVFKFLVELNTSEGDDLVEQVLLDTQTNEDFADFVQILQQANRLELLSRLNPDELTRNKAAILRAALRENIRS